MESNPYKDVKKIFDTSKKITDIITKTVNVDFELVYYEEIFFFYFLNDVSLNIIEAPVEFTTRILPSLKHVLLLSKLPKYKEYEEFIDLFIAFRTKNYCNLLFKYSEKITVDFLIEAFHYQSELIIFIQENNQLNNPKNIPSPLTEWIQKAAQNDYLQTISKTLADNIDIFLDYINPLAIEIID